MSDPLKIFISQHRNALDTSVPDAHHWKGLSKALERLPQADAMERSILCDRILLDTAAAPTGLWAKISSALDCHLSQADPLECFIRENRDALDMERPDRQLWTAISQNLPTVAAAAPRAKVLTMGWQRHLLRAAAAIALLICGVGLGIWYAGGSATDGPFNRNGMAMSDVSTEYAELEDYYQRDIASKKEQLLRFTSNNKSELEGDLLQMDKAMEELRAELSHVPPGNREQVVRAMIENYKAKASILQRVLERLEETEAPENQPKSSKNDTERI